MNIITAYAVVQHLKKRHGSTYKRDVLQFLNRTDNLEQTLNDMAQYGMVALTGTGQKGDPRIGRQKDPKTVTLTEQGREFANSFEQGSLSYAYLIPDNRWAEFRDRAAAKGIGASVALEKAMRAYIHMLDSNPF